MAEIEDAEIREAIVMKVASGASFPRAAKEFMTSEREISDRHQGGIESAVGCLRQIG
jgi:hypothetical protein